MNDRIRILENIQNHFDAIWALFYELDDQEDAYIIEMIGPEFNDRAFPGCRHSLSYELNRYIEDLKHGQID